MIEVLEVLEVLPVDPADTDIFTVDEAYGRAMERGALCLECPLYGLRQGPVLGDIRRAELMGIAEAPGGQEIKQRQVLVGLTGDDVVGALNVGGYRREQVSLTNVLKCRPPGGQDLSLWLAANKRAGKKSPIDCCRPALEKDIEETQPLVYLTLGKYALEEIAHRYGLGVGADDRDSGKFQRTLGAIQDQAGHPEELADGRILYPTLHPSYAMRGAHHLAHVIREEIHTACRIAKRGHVDFEEPDYILDPSPQQILDWCEETIQGGAESVHVFGDIETDSIAWDAQTRCVGLGVWRDGKESIIVIPVAYKNGSRVFNDSDVEAIRLGIRRVLRCKKNVFHNGAFDTRLLELYGFRARSDQSVWDDTWDDTQIGHHTSYECNSPHKLSHVSKRFLELFLWKVDVDHKVARDEFEALEQLPPAMLKSLLRYYPGKLESRIADKILWLYNARDILATMRSWAWRGTGIEHWIDRDDMRKPYEVDKKKALVFRDAGELGMFVDRRKQEDNARILRTATRKMEKKLRHLAGFDPDDDRYNPNSGDDVADLIYGEWKYSPLAYTETGAPATGIPALLSLCNHGVDEKAKKYIDLHVVYKSHRKLLDAFVVNLPLLPTEWDHLGIFHTTFNVHVVPSGRLSHSDPNSSNWPKRAVINMRPMVVPPPGYAIIDDDMDQGEARVFAVIAKDEFMLDAFRRGLDVHALNAATLFAKAQSEIWPIYEEIVRKKKMPKGSKENNEAEQLRLIAKVFCFSEQYGTQEQGLADFMSTARDKATGILMFPGITEKRIRFFHQNYHKHHTTCREWQLSRARMGTILGKVSTHINLRWRHFPEKPNKDNAPSNHEIQGTLADIVDNGTLAIYEQIGHRKLGKYAGICNQVHDQLLAYAPLDQAKRVADIFDECLPCVFGGLPMTATAEISMEWSGEDIRGKL